MLRLWKGKNKTGIVLDSSRLRGSIAKVFENALNFIERNTKTGWVKTENGGRDEIRSYPKEAVREALVNAIAIEIILFRELRLTLIFIQIE